MPDVYATIEQADESVQERLADVLELRAGDLQQRAMLEDYLNDLPLPAGARILEIGCGTGAVARTLVTKLAAREVVGIDPGPLFIEQARRRAGGIDRLTFVIGDGPDLPFEDDSFDAVVCHTTLCHIPGPERVLDEALRVIAPMAGLPCSMVTTSRRRSRSPTTIHYRCASAQRSRRSSTIAF